MNLVGREMKAALRSLRANGVSSAMAVVTLALGIGGTTAIFSLMNAVMLRSLPIPHPEQLTALATTIADDVNGDEPFSLQMYLELRRRQAAFSDVFAWNGGTINTFEAQGQRHTAAIASVTGNYFRTIGVAPLLGRFLEERDVALESGTSPAVAVVSYRVWRAWYHGTANIIGQTIRVGTQPFTIIGVEPEEFSGLIIDGAADVTIPVFAPGQLGSRERRMLFLRLFGRLKPGVGLAAARAHLLTLWPRVQEDTLPPGYEGERRTRFFARKLTLDSAATGISVLRKRFSYSLRILLALVGVVLFIACLNLANLALSRSAAGQHELGVRSALGATAIDLMRQPFLEGFLLASLGAAAGLLLAAGASGLLLRVAWTGLIETALRPELDGRVLGFTAVLTMMATVLTGLAPAWRAARSDALSALQRQSRTVRGGARGLGRGLLIMQVSLAVLLVVGALLFTETLRHLHGADVGYRRDHLLTLMLFPQGAQLEDKDAPAYFRQLAERVKRIPGVANVSLSHDGPAGQSEMLFQIYSRADGSDSVQAVRDTVAPDFFRTMGMRVLAGREFSWQDREGDSSPAVISESLARRLFGNSDPVGRTIYQGPHTYPHKLHVVGVVNSASLWRVESEQPMAIYRELIADGRADPMLDVRTAGNPVALKASVENAVRSLGRHYSLRTSTVEERLDSFLSVQRLMAMVSTFFAMLAVLIAAVGLYGLLSFHIAQRRAEFGIRFALGAQRKDVLWMVEREAIALTGLGCAIGLAGAFLMSGLVRSVLFGVSPVNPLIFGAAAMLLLAVSLTAGAIPARRAAQADPMAALRAE
jgi:putative ABC transport system permease protein